MSVGLHPEKSLASKVSCIWVQTYNLGNWARTRQGGIGSTIHEPLGHYGGGSGQDIYFGEIFLIEGRGGMCEHKFNAGLVG